MVFGPEKHVGKLACRLDRGHDVNTFHGLTMSSRLQVAWLC